MNPLEVHLLWIRIYGAVFFGAGVVLLGCFVWRLVQILRRRR